MKGFNNLVLYIVLLLALLFFFIPSPPESSTMLKLLYIVINILILVRVKYKYGTFFNLLTIFLVLVLYFNGTRIILDLFGYDDMRRLSFFSEELISEINNSRALLNINIGIIAVALGYLWLKPGPSKIEDTSWGNMDVFLLLFFLVGFLAKLYVSYLSFSFISLLSYYDFFTEGLVIPKYLKILSSLPVFVCLVKFREGKGGWWIVAMFVYAILSMATGQRGPGMLLFVMTFYMCVKMNFINVGILNICIIIVFVVATTVVVGMLRVAGDVDSEFSVLEFLWKQGVSISVLQLTVQHADLLDYNFYDLFGNISQWLDRTFFERGKVVDILTDMANHKVWSQYVSYRFNPKLFSLGYGLGGNFFGQAYAVGREFAVFVISFFSGLFLHFMEKKLFSKNVIMVYVSFTVLCSFIYIPRDNLLDFVTDFVVPLYVLVIFLFIRVLVNDGKKQLSSFN